MFSVWGATVVQKLAQDHTLQHHKQLLLQMVELQKELFVI